MRNKSSQSQLRSNRRNSNSKDEVDWLRSETEQARHQESLIPDILVEEEILSQNWSQNMVLKQ